MQAAEQRKCLLRSLVLDPMNVPPSLHLLARVLLAPTCLTSIVEDVTSKHYDRILKAAHTLLLSSLCDNFAPGNDVNWQVSGPDSMPHLMLSTQQSHKSTSVSLDWDFSGHQLHHVPAAARLSDGYRTTQNFQFTNEALTLCSA